MRIFVFILMFVLFQTPLRLYAEIASGNDCGNNCTWTISDDGVLDIRGTGNIKDFPGGNTPWLNYKDDIKAVNVNQGITAIGVYAFYYLRKATSVSLPEGLTTIYGGAFESMIHLQNINIPSSVEYIGTYAFSHDGILSSLVIPDSARLEYKALVNISDNANIYCNITAKKLCEEAFDDVGRDKSLLKIYEKSGNQYLYNNKFYSSLSSISNNDYNKKRIYTIDEASKLSKSQKNTIKLKYK